MPLLAGCESDGDVAAAPPAVMAVPAMPVSDRHAAAVEETSARFCARMARERAADTDQQDLGDDGFRQEVYDKTYAECMAWQHRAVIDAR